MPPPPPLAPPDFVVGRAAESAALGGLLAELVAGRGRVAWIEGEPGIGKSTLAGQLVRAAATARGCRVFRATAAELTQPLPLRLMADCLRVSTRSRDPLRTEIADLLRGAGQAGTLDPVLAAGERMVELVDRMCAAGPVLLVTENLHWADEASVLVWYQLAHSTEQIPLLLVGTSRLVPRREPVLRLRRSLDDLDAAVVELGPLEPRQAAELAGLLIGAPPGPWLRDQLGQAGGNPLYVREVVDALLREDLVQITATGAEPRGQAGPAPQSLTAAIGRRLGFLTEDTRDVLRIAAVLGAAFWVTELAAAAGRTVAGLLPAMDEAASAGVLTHDAQRMLFRHELIRHALQEEIQPPVRAAVHSQLARQHAEATHRIGQVAAHLLAAGNTLDDWALGWLAELPDTALYAAPQVAADLLGRAVEQTGPDDPRWEALARRLTSVLFWLRHEDELDRVAEHVLRHTSDPDVTAQMCFHLATTRSRGRYGEALEVARRGLDDPRLPAAWRGRLRGTYATTLWYMGRNQEAASEARQAIAEAEQAGDRLGRGWARHALGGVFSVSDPEECLHQLELVLDGLGDDPDSMELRLFALQNRAVILANVDRYADSDAVLREAMLLAERAGTARLAATRRIMADYSYERGDWDGALLHLAGVHLPLPDQELLMIYGVYALIAARREDRATAAQRLATAAAQVRVTTGHLLDFAEYLVAARAVLAEAAGDLPGAVAELACWLDPAVVAPAARADWMPELVRLALAAGDAGTARAAAEAAGTDAAASRYPAQDAAARRCRALLDDDTGTLLSVADYYRTSGRRVDLAATLEEAAARLAAAGDVPAARAALTEAVRFYHEVGAGSDMRRADSRLHDYGVRRGSHSLRRRPQTGWDALTRTERHVAQLVASGLSNPDIASQLYLSRRTVHGHVSNILRKLQVRSRRDVAVAAGRQAAAQA